MAHVSSMLQSNGTMDTKSKPTFVLLGHPFLLVCLITCLFAPLCAFFPCLHVLCVCLVLSLFLCYLFCLSAGFVLFIYLLLHVHVWSEGTTSKVQAKKGKNASKRGKPKKGNDQQIRRLSLPMWLFLSLSQHFLQNHVYRFLDQDFLSLYLAQAAFLGFGNV